MKCPVPAIEFEGQSKQPIMTLNIALAMPDHLNPFYGRLNRLCIHPIWIILLQPRKQPRTDQLHQLTFLSPNSTVTGEAAKPAQTCGVVVDGERAGLECRATLVERGGQIVGA
jgi:hypothetical protein